MLGKYLIESPHTNKGCLEALDEMLAKDPEFLAKFDWGCSAGDHTGWAVVEAESESAARNMMPTSLRSQARIVKVGKFTPEQIRSLHQK